MHALSWQSQYIDTSDIICGYNNNDDWEKHENIMSDSLVHNFYLKFFYH